VTPADLDAARSFLTVLDESTDAFCFRAIWPARDGTPAKNFTGTFDQVSRHLVQYNAKGYGIYVVVNEGGHDGDSIRRVRSVYADNDIAGLPLQVAFDCGLEPHVAVETSPGKWHTYWLVDDLPLDKFSAVQSAIAAKLGTDTNVSDLPRVMRLPGFDHTKGERHRVRIVHESGALPYTAEKILAAFPPAAMPASQAAPASSAAAIAVDPGTIAELRAALASMRADDRKRWIAMGCALRELGDVGRALWVEWSQTSAEWQPSDAMTWDTLKHDRTGYRAVFAAAQEGGWVNPLSNAATLPVARKPSAQAPAIASAADLLTREFAPVQWGVHGILPEGVSILSGDPKIGKSWLLYQATIAVAAGRPLWPGRGPEQQGDALMLALEDNDRRLQRRLNKLLPRFVRISARGFDHADVTRLHYATEWPRAEDGIAHLTKWLRDHPDCRLVVVDTVSAFRQKDVSKQKSAYAADYEVGEMFKPLAREFSCAIVLVMHNRKQSSNDALQMVSGTQGMTGGVDNVLVMRRERGQLDAGLYVDGRDIEEPQEIALRFDDGFWSSDGRTVSDAQMSKERQAVLDALHKLGGKAKIREIADLLPQGYGAVRKLVTTMVRSGQLKNEGGTYSPLTAGNSGNEVTAEAA